jgi:hypothetical protein
MYSRPPHTIKEEERSGKQDPGAEFGMPGIMLINKPAITRKIG